MRRITLRMDDELAQRVDELVGRHGSLNGWLCEAIESRVKWLEGKRSPGLWQLADMGIKEIVMGAGLRGGIDPSYVVERDEWSQA